MLEVAIISLGGLFVAVGLLGGTFLLFGKSEKSKDDAYDDMVNSSGIKDMIQDKTVITDVKDYTKSGR